MDNSEKLKNSNVEVYASMLSLAVEQTKLLKTILDVLIDNRLESGSKESNEVFIQYVQQKLKDNADYAIGTMILKPTE